MADDVELVGSAETEAALQRLAELVHDLRPFWPLVVPLFNSWMKRQFESEGQFFGEAWAPLTDQYAAWKMQHYPDKGLLSAEGDLRRAATSPKRKAFPELLVLTIAPYPKTTRSEALTATGRRSRARVKTDKIIDPDWFQSGTNRMVARPLLAEVLPTEANENLRVAADLYIRENAAKLGL